MKQAQQKLWVIEQRDLWGDYGAVLISGYARRDGDQAPLALHRTGPFLPPVSFPWITNTAGRAIVVTKEFKEELEAIGLPDLMFREADRTRIIPLSWETWDLTAPNPAKYPEEGEPANYVWNEPHNPDCAAKMEIAFEFIPPLAAIDVDFIENLRDTGPGRYVVKSLPDALPPFFRSHPTHGDFIVDDTMKAWFEKHAGSWVQFVPVQRAKSKSPR